MHRGSVTRRGGKGEVKDKDAESGEDAETAGAPGETVAELDSSFAIACRSPMRLALGFQSRQSHRLSHVLPWGLGGKPEKPSSTDPLKNKHTHQIMN